MGNTIECPLPKKIPIPNDEQRLIMIKWGIKLHEPDVECEYIEYILPDGWQIIEQSNRSDLPIFNIIDDQRFKRICIDGSWKGAYDNKLYLSCYKEPFEKIKEKSIDEIEYDSLIREYEHSIEFTSGCGERGQFYIDTAFQKLKEWIESHPGTPEKLPRRHICQNDGTDGVSTGLAIAIRGFRIININK